MRLHVIYCYPGCQQRRQDAAVPKRTLKPEPTFPRSLAAEVLKRPAFVTQYMVARQQALPYIPIAAFPPKIALSLQNVLLVLVKIEWFFVIPVVVLVPWLDLLI